MPGTIGQSENVRHLIENLACTGYPRVLHDAHKCVCRPAASSGGVFQRSAAGRAYNEPVASLITQALAGAAIADPLRAGEGLKARFVLLDALTNGGLGVAFFSPLDDSRCFFLWRPLLVSPIGIRAFFSAWGVEVLRSELVWVWIPAATLWAIVRLRPSPEVRAKD